MVRARLLATMLPTSLESDQHAWAWKSFHTSPFPCGAIVTICCFGWVMPSPRSARVSRNSRFRCLLWELRRSIAAAGLAYSLGQLPYVLRRDIVSAYWNAVIEQAWRSIGPMRRLSSGWAALNECRHCVDIATPLADPLDPPGHPSGRVLCEDRARLGWVIERQIAAGYHVDRLSATTL